MGEDGRMKEKKIGSKMVMIGPCSSGGLMCEFKGNFDFDKLVEKIKHDQSFKNLSMSEKFSIAKFYHGPKRVFIFKNKIKILNAENEQDIKDTLRALEIK